MLLGLFTLCTAGAWAEDIALKDGRVLANASIVSQGPRTVTIKHAAGLTAVNKAQLSSELQIRYPIDEAAARKAEQRAEADRAAAQQAAAAEKERTALLRAQHEVTSTAQEIAAAKDAAELAARQESVKSGARAAALSYFEQEYSPVPRTTPKVEVTINEFRPVEGWSGRWLVKGQALIRRYKDHEVELNLLYASRPADIAGQDRRIQQIRSLESDHTNEIVDFECTYPTDGSAPSFDIKLHT